MYKLKYTDVYLLYIYYISNGKNLSKNHYIAIEPGKPPSLPCED